jgi:hypothetical protein
MGEGRLGGGGRRAHLAFIAPLAALFLIANSSAKAQDPATAHSRVHNLKVISDKVDDVSTVESILHSFVKPGMSDEDRSLALWRAVVKYRHQTIPAMEFLAADWESHDPVKIFNVYGYCMCCCCSALIESLNRADGRQARGRILTGHSVPEVRFADGWHMYDASLISLFPLPETGAPASVDQVCEAIARWYAQHPEYKENVSALMELMKSEGWTGWKSKGPELLAKSPYYHLGFLPARTHGWNDTMSEYGPNCAVYEYGYQVGHRAVFSLRPGESLERDAGNRRLHVNMDRVPDWDMLDARAPERDLVYLEQFFPGYRGGVVGNGYHRYGPNLARGELETGCEVYENLATGGFHALHPKAGGKAGVAVVELSCPYVYLGGRVRLKGQRARETDQVVLSLSTSNGRQFVPVWKADATGPFDAEIDLGERIRRRYSYWLQIEIQSESPQGTGLDTFSVESEIQHAPRTLPWLGRGQNTITVSTDRDATIATRTISCLITPDVQFNKNETTGSMGVQFENLDVRDGSCWWKAGEGSMTVPVETPGELVALRFSAQVRARGNKDLVQMLVSTDQGKTWQEAGHIAGPTPGATGSFRFDGIPPGTKRAHLKFRLSGNNTIGIFSFRVDADYRDPLSEGAAAPIQVVHRWREKGMPREHVELVQKLPATYKIATEAEPEMVSVTYAMPAGKSAR